MQASNTIDKNNNNNYFFLESQQELMQCKCGLCNHHSRADCINGHCYCCDLEDMFSILAQMEFEPRSKIVASRS